MQMISERTISLLQKQVGIDDRSLHILQCILVAKSNKELSGMLQISDNYCRLLVRKLLFKLSRWANDSFKAQYKKPTLNSLRTFSQKQNYVRAFLMSLEQ